MPAAEPSLASPANTGTLAAEHRMLDAINSELRRARGDLPRLEREVARLREALGRARRTLAASQALLARARHQAQRDALTGLPNRHGFDALSERALAAHLPGAHVLALLFVDLDGFKAINDQLGHGAGDEILRLVGARLSHAVRSGDLVCRHGGDEFVCLLPHLDNAQRAEAIADLLVRALAAPMQLGPHRVSVRASVGIAMYPRDGQSMEALLQHADRAMYAAKSVATGAGHRVRQRTDDETLATKDWSAVTDTTEARDPLPPQGLP